MEEMSTTVTQDPTTTLPDTSTTELPTTVAETTLPTTTAAPIPTFTWNLIDITNNIVIGQYYNLTVIGPSAIKNSGLSFTGGVQYLQFGTHAHSCLLNPMACQVNGFTFQFTFEYTKIEENTYLLTSGGETPDGPGMAIVYRFGQLQIVMSTLKLSWYTSVSKNEIPKNTPTTMTISWNVNIGLEVFVNNVFVTANTLPVPHNPTPTNVSIVYFGKQTSISTKVEFVLQTVTIWHAHIDLLVTLGYCPSPVRPTGRFI